MAQKNQNIAQVKPPIDIFELLKTFADDGDIPDDLPSDYFDHIYEGSDFLTPHKDTARDAIFQAILSRSVLHNTNQLALRTERRTTHYQKYLRKRLALFYDQISTEQRNWLMNHAADADALLHEIQHIKHVPKTPVIEEKRREEEEDLLDRNRRHRRKKLRASKIWKAVQVHQNQPMPAACSKDYFNQTTDNLKIARFKLQQIDIKRQVSPRLSITRSNTFADSTGVFTSSEEEFDEYSDSESDSDNAEAPRSKQNRSHHASTAKLKGKSRLSDVESGSNVKPLGMRRQVTFFVGTRETPSSRRQPGLKSKSVDISQVNRLYEKEIAPFRARSQNLDGAALKKQSTRDNKETSTDTYLVPMGRSLKTTATSVQINTLPKVDNETRKIRKPSNTMILSSHQRAQQALEASKTFLLTWDSQEETNRLSSYLPALH